MILGDKIFYFKIGISNNTCKYKKPKALTSCCSIQQIFQINGSNNILNVSLKLNHLST